MHSDKNESEKTVHMFETTMGRIKFRLFRKFTDAREFVQFLFLS